MGVERTGVEAVVVALNRFLTDVGRVNRAYTQMGDAANRAANQVAKAGRGIQSAQDRQAQATNNVQRAAINGAQAMIRETQAQERLIRLRSSGVATTRELAKAEDDLAIATGNTDKALISVEDAQIRQAAAARAAAQAQQDQIAAVANAGNAFNMLTVLVPQLTASFSLLSLGARIVVSTFDLFRGAIQGVSSVIGGIVNGVRGLVNAFSNATRPIRDFIGQVLAFAGGNLLANGIRNLASQFQELTGNMTESLSTFQKITIQFDALAARDYAEKFGVPMTQAFQATSGAAKQLIDWVTQLAVTTPYTAQKISETLAMANAMGLNINMAKELTNATINFTSTMGLNEEHIFRVVYNFGQMLAQGKLNGREFRDLANSFIPVNKLLTEMADKAGMEKEAFRDLAFSGGVPVEAFFKEFIDLIGRDYPDAAKRMARTWEGVTNNIKDFFQIILGTKIFGPMFNDFTARAADLLDRLLSPAVRRAAETIGIGLQFAFRELQKPLADFGNAIMNVARALGLIPSNASSVAVGLASISGVISAVLNRITAFLNTVGVNMANRLRGIASQAGSWGYNIVLSLANGMARAAAAVIQVITYIGKIISGWLSAHSPPKLLPDLPKWGMAAMNSYLQGFTQADFDLLKGLQDPLKSALDILEETGKIGEGQGGKILADLSGSIAAAISGGGELPFAEIAGSVKQLGPLGGAISELAKRQIIYAGSLKGVSDAEKEVQYYQEQEEAVAIRLKEAKKQETEASRMAARIKREEEAATRALEEAKKREERSRVSLNESIRSYNSMLRSGAGKDELAAKLKQVNANESMARQATLQRKDAELQVERMKELYDKAQEIVDNMRNRVELIQEEDDAAKELVDLAQARLDKIKEQSDALEEQVKLQEQLVQQLIDLTKGQIIQPEQPETETGGAGGAGGAPDMGDVFGDLGGVPQIGLPQIGMGNLRQFEQLQSQMDKAKEDAEKKANEIADAILKPFKDLAPQFTEMTNIWGNILSGFFSAKSAGMGDLRRFEETGIAPKNEAAKAIIKFFNDVKLATEPLIGTFMLLAKIVKDSLGGELERLARNLSDLGVAMGGTSGAAMGLRFAFAGLGAVILLTLMPILGYINGLVSAAASWVNSFREFLDAMALFSKGIEEMIGGKFWQGLIDIIKGTWGAIWAVVTSPLDAIGSLIAGFARTVIAVFTNLYDTLVGKSIVPDMMDAIQTCIEDTLNKIGEFIKNKLEEIRKWFQEKFEAIKNKASEVMESVRSTIETKVNAVKNAIETITTILKTSWDAFWDGVRTKVETAIEGVRSTVDTKINEVKTSIDTATDAIKSKWDTIWDGLKSKIDAIWTNAGSIKDSIITGIDEVKTAFEVTLTNAINQLVNGPLYNLSLGLTNIIDKFKNFIEKAAEAAGIKPPKDSGSSSGYQGSYGYNDQKASGGSYSAAPFIAGEKGWELIVPRYSGRVFNQTQLAQMSPVQMAPVSMGLGGVYSRTLNVNMVNNVEGGIGLAQIELATRNAIRSEFA